MALHWEWTDIVGATLNDRNCINTIYAGNAYAIALERWREDGETWWNMAWFAVDRQHMKNMLGLNRKEGFTDNIFEARGITDVYLLREWGNAAHMVSDILKSGWKVNIHLIAADELNEITEV